MVAAVGQPVLRNEDRRLLIGHGRFSDDFSLPGQGYAAILRSSHAHARLRDVDVARARTMPGVLGVFTGVDCAGDGLGEIDHSPLPKTPFDLKLSGPSGGPVFLGDHHLLPVDRVRYAGEPVAIVVAETYERAADAVEAIAVEYDPLPVVTDAAAAPMPGAPRLWDQCPDNVSVDCCFGDADATDAAFGQADHVVGMRFRVGRVTGVPLEPRAALGSYDPATGRYTLYAGSGGAVRQKHELAAVLGVQPERLRVLSFDVGGNFGTRNRVYPEFGLVLWASRRVGRPVKFTCTRGEAFLTDYQGRDLLVDMELALDREGRFLALRSSHLSNVGARIVSLSPLSKGCGIVTGSYAIPAAHVRARAVFTNTVPTQAYRSSGRPEVIFAVERLIDTAAAELGFDRVALRRRNLVPERAMPYRNGVGMVYDSGEYAACLDKALALADYDGFPARREAARREDRLLGLGVAHYVESSIGAPREQAQIHVRPEGWVEVVVGTQPSGQGHETSFAQVAADALELPFETIRILLGDTDIVRVGGGSHSGRSMRMAGAVILKASKELIERGRVLAGHVLEAAAADIGYAEGHFVVEGTDRAISLFDLAAVAEQDDVPDTLRGGLAVMTDNEMFQPVFPNGCHVCEVEVDPETGAVRINRYTAVDDVGRAINPMIVHGQTHGGIVQGLGQAMAEQCIFDAETAQPLCGSLMDYGLPRADEFPFFTTALHEVPSPTNPLGVKAGGEGGTTPAPAVLISAIVDALRPFGVRDIELPATPFRVWQAMRARDSRSPRSLSSGGAYRRPGG